MEIKDYTNIIKTSNFEYKNFNKFAPTWDDSGGFRMLVIGPSGCGKTNMICSLLLNDIFYDRIFIYAKDIHEPFYKFLESVFKLSKENKILKDYQITDHIDEKIDLGELQEIKEKGGQTLIIFDDFINESKQDHKPICTLYTQGRKKGCSTIYISQSFFAIPEIIRKNANYLSIYKLADDDDAKRIFRRYSGGDKDKVFNLYKNATDDKHNFFLIDTKTNNDILKYRRNWDELYF